MYVHVNLGEMFTQHVFGEYVLIVNTLIILPIFKKSNGSNKIQPPKPIVLGTLAYYRNISNLHVEDKRIF